jgi:hypothetical protein
MLDFYADIYKVPHHEKQEAHSSAADDCTRNQRNCTHGITRNVRRSLPPSSELLARLRRMNVRANARS